MKIKNIITIVIITTIGNSMFAQNNKKVLIQGNKYYNDSLYELAEEKYRLYLEKDKKNKEKVNFNLANSLYKQNNFEQASLIYDIAIEKEEDQELKSNIYYNKANSLLKNKKIEESIEYYKKALQSNRYNEEAKYNLSYANRLLNKQEKENKQNKEEKKEQEKKQNEGEKQEQENKQNEGAKQEQENKQSEEKEENKQKEENKINKEEALKMLKAAEEKEKEIQKKIQKKRMKTTKIKVEKDW